MASPGTEMSLKDTDPGELNRYIDSRVFGTVLDSLRALIERKKAIADETRYSILYLLYETDILGRKTISGLTGQNEEGLEHHLRKLRNSNLIARVNTPDGLDGRRTYYRITMLGREEIEADLRNIHSAFAAKRLAGSQVSFSEINQFMVDVGRPSGREQLDDPDWLASKRKSLRSKHDDLILTEDAVPKS